MDAGTVFMIIGAVVVVGAVLYAIALYNGLVHSSGSADSIMAPMADGDPHGGGHVHGVFTAS